MLPARGANQPVHWVVGVVASRIDALIVEVNNVLPVGRISNARDVAHWIVVISEVLNILLVRRDGIWPVRYEIGQPEGLRIIGVGGHGFIAERNINPLAARVVIDSGDRAKAGRRRIE